jgi:ABC-type multidrug transport system ATPase subunit
MEEADTLCNRIGIVYNGQLQAIGSQSHLKSKFGDGFKLTLNLSLETDFVVPNPSLPLQPQQYQLMQEPIEMDQQTTPPSVTRRVLHFIQDSIYPSAILSSYNSRRMQFILPHPAGHSSAFATTYLPAVLSVFDRMEEFKGRLLTNYRIQEWGLAHASLEEVFINCVRQAEQKQIINKEE